MKKPKKIKSFISLLLSLTLLLGCFSNVVQAREMPSTGNLNNKNHLDKIEQKVKQKFDSGEELLEVLVYLKDRVDTAKIASLSAKGKTLHEKELSARKSVINSLKEKAEITQAPIISYLEKQKTKNKVRNIKSFHIANIVYVKANKEVIEELAKRSDVEKVYYNDTIEIDKPLKTEATNTVTDMPEDEIGWNIKQIGAPKVWENFKVDGTGVVVGVLDSGVDWDNPALKEKWRGYDKTTGQVVNPKESWYDPMTNSELPWDNSGVPHGSHCTGTILGQEPDGKNTIGVAPGAQWIAAKAFTDAGGQRVHLLAGAQWFLAPGGNAEKAPDIINNSWGGSAGVDPWFVDILNAWRAAGILPVFAAGNQKTGEPIPGPGSIQNPSNLPGSFAVGATDINNKRGNFSKLGPSPWNPELIKPEISAPGVNIRSSVIDGYEAGWDGTSMAAPHVAGVAALMKSANFSLTVEEMEKILKETATKLTDNQYAESPNMGYGYGLVNAYDAVAKVLGIGTGTIEGQVLVPGEDKIAPEIVHGQLPEVFANTASTITAEIKDNVGVTSAKLLVKNADMSQWQEIAMKRVSGNAKSGTYEAIVPGNLVIKQGLEYKISVSDYSKNTFTSEVYNLTVMFGIKPDKYSNDFEKDVLGWKLSGEFQWGAPTSTSGPKALSGSKVIGTKLESYDVSPNTVSEVLSPPLDLRDTNLKEASLRISEWNDISYSHNAEMLISTDEGATWKQLRKVTGSNKEWHEVYLDLASYIGNQKPVFVKFKFTTGSAGFGIGWYFENMSFVGTDKEAPSVPSNFTAAINKSGVALNWNKVTTSDFKQYNIYRGTTQGGPYSNIATTINPYYTDTDVKTGMYYYVVTSVDFTGNESVYSQEVALDYKEIKKIFYTNFEKDNGGFTTGILSDKGKNNDWAWGAPTSGPKAALTGTKVWATNLAGNYSYDHAGYLDTPAINLPADEETVLSVDHWLDAYSYVYNGTDDFANVQISEDNGTTWTVLKDSMKGAKKWETLSLDLSAYKGKSVKVRFYLYTNGLMGAPGWYIDSVAVLPKASVSNNNTNSIVSIAAAAETQAEETQEPKAQADQFVEGFLPADAVVTILETGRSVKTDPATGNFTITHAGNKEGESYTLRTVAYGYHPKEVQVSLKEEQTITQQIKLDPIKKGNVVGKVIDKASNAPVANATVRILEDSNYESVTTDAEGNFTIKGVFAGEYTLRVTNENFHTENIKVTVEGEKDNSANIAMRKFHNTEEEISYDDGIKDASTAFTNSGAGFGVKFTPKSYGRVGYANIFFVDDHSKALGNKIGIGIAYLDEKGEVQLAGDLKEITINRGQWNKINLLDFDYSTDKDFYIVTKQLYPVAESPAIGIDKNSTANDRSYVYNGGLTPIAEYKITGSMMVRAIMQYETEAPAEEVKTPEINNLKELNYLNKDTVTLEGKTNVDGKVNIFVNGASALSVDTDNKMFKAELKLKEGENTITVNGEANGKTSDMSVPIKVIVDKTLPELKVTVPADEALINATSIEVTGTVADKYLNKVVVNDKEVVVDEKGNFKTALDAVKGENQITVTATDLAGNQTTVTKKVNVVTQSVETPEITNLKETTYVNKDSIILEGKMNVDGKINVYVNGKKTASAETKDKNFAINIELTAEVNTITVTGEENKIETTQSAPVKVIVDKKLPELKVKFPKDKELINKKSIKISGTVKDKNLKNVTVNGKEVCIDKKGSFKIDVDLVPGKNTITVIATDLAGNQSTLTETVNVVIKGNPDKGNDWCDSIIGMIIGGIWAFIIELLP
ncbi:S8 family serine peptidase [Clostridium tunisiense]|uniref:S8 family serine peptidase n=1 Tax=Clostridium tunisiense TaxID=219748 RepID=UPI0003693F75|nr:S8 family serine peptidase [Clostridium tunisiense]